MKQRDGFTAQCDRRIQRRVGQVYPSGQERTVDARKSWVRFAASLLAMMLLLTGFYPMLSMSHAYEGSGVAGNGNPHDLSQDSYASLIKGLKPESSSASKVQAPKVPTVYLTFDDGPGPYTKEVLDILKKEKVPATFFVLGELAEYHPDTIKRIVKEGHALGNHTYNHKYSEIYADFANFWQQVVKTENILNQIAGVRPNIVRAPGGTYTNFDSFYFYYLEAAGYQVYDWNVDSGDSKRRGVPASEIVNNIKNAPLKQEMNVLMHDGGAREQTVKALPEIIQYFKDLGYRFEAITDTTHVTSFNIGPSKWNRNYSKQKHQDVLALIDQAEHESGDAVQRTIVAQQRFTPDLTLVGEGRSLRFANHDYKVMQDQLIVPARSVVEHLGGSISWDGERETAMIKLGSKRIELQVANKLMVDFSRLGKASQQQWNEIFVEEGRLMVPIRSLLNALDYEVQSYAMELHKREVVYQSNPAYALTIRRSHALI